MNATLWVLGSAGWMPQAGQETSCFLLEAGEHLIMLDAGTGVANLDLAAEVLARHDRLSVLLSHYHLDHVVGLMYLKRFAAGKRVDVYGPGRPVYPKTTEEYAGDLLQSALYSSGSSGFAREVRYHDYGGRDFDVCGLPVAVRPQIHSSPSFELRVGDLVTYATAALARVLAGWCRRPAAHERRGTCGGAAAGTLWQGAAHSPQSLVGRRRAGRGRADRRAPRHRARSRRHGHCALGLSPVARSCSLGLALVERPGMSAPFEGYGREQ